jgi:hypothetical protein
MNHPSEYRNLAEAHLNKWANSISHNYKIPPNSFRISLIEDKGPRLGSRDHFPLLGKVTNNGSVLQIQIVFPWIDKKGSFEENLKKSVKSMKRTIKRMFQYISNPKFHQDEDFFNPLIISNKMHEYVSGLPGTRAWSRKKYDPTVVNGHKKREFKLEVKREIIVNMTHKRTGISYTVKNKTGRSEYDLIQECWEKCSEIVDELERDKETKTLVPMSFYEHSASLWLELSVRPFTEEYIH